MTPGPWFSICCADRPKPVTEARLRLWLLASALVFNSACSENPERLLASAQRHLDRDEVAAAVIDARNAIKASPESGPARQMLGRAILANGEIDAAEAEFRRAQTLGLAETALAVDLASVALARQRPADVLQRWRDTRLPDAAQDAELRVLLAQAALRQGDVVGADAYAEQALQVVPDAVPARVVQARLAGSRQDIETTRRITAELVARHPDDAQVRLLQADLLAQDPAQRAQAILAYRRVLELRPRQVQAHATLIALHLQARDLPAAADQAAALRKAIPGSPVADYFQAVVAHHQGDAQRTRELTQRLLGGSVEDPRVLFLAGMAEARLGALAPAERLLAKAVRLQPEALEPRRELAALHLRRGRPQDALDVLRPEFAARRPDAALWRVAGQAYTMAGDFERADQAFAQAREHAPEDGQLDIAIGGSLLARGQLDAGLQALRAAAGREDTRLAAELALISTQMNRRQFDEALRGADRLAAASPSDPAPLHLRGQISEHRGDAAGARTAYEAAVALQPTFSPALTRLADLDRAERRFDDAMRRLRALVAADPRASRAMLTLAELELRAGTPRERAFEWVAKAVRASPLDATVWRTAVALHLSTGDPVGALSRAQAALVARPDDPEVLALVADTQLTVGEPQQALSAVQELVRKHPESADGWLRLARVLTHSGRWPPPAPRPAWRPRPTGLQQGPRLLGRPPAHARAAHRTSRPGSAGRSWSATAWRQSPSGASPLRAGAAGPACAAGSTARRPGRADASAASTDARSAG
jgi:putative PEP-CTERM system TPR-repeat lipoprotein